MNTRLSQLRTPAAGDRLLELTHIFGMLCLISSPVWATSLLFPNPGFPPGTAMLIFPALIALSLFLTSRVAKKDLFLREVMLVGMAIRFLSTALFLQLYFRVWQGGDLDGYYYRASVIFNEFYRSDRLIFFLPFKLQNVVFDLAGSISLFTGLSLSGLCLIFSFFAFIGQILFFKAFCAAFPNVNTRMPAMVFFMLPSMLFWTSFLSKDSLIFVMLAMSFYGFIRTQKSGFKFAPILAFGLVGVSLIRPHIGGMVAVAYGAGFLLTTNRKGYLVLVAKLTLGPALLVGVGYQIANATTFVQAETVDEGVNRLQTLHKNLQVGGSSTGNASLGVGLALAPTLAFRPLIFEVHNPQMAVSFVEGSLLFWAFWNRRKGIYASLKNARSSPALVAAGIFCIQFMIVFSIGIGNIGTLVRERTMMLPFWFFLVFSVEPVKRIAQNSPAVRRLRALREMTLHPDAIPR